MDTQIEHIDVIAIAHRGSSSEASENTLAAFRLAKEIGADYIELDVQLTKDNVPVIFHDPVITRTTNSKLPHAISDLNLAELRNLDAGSWFDPRFAGEKIPTLEEAINLAAALNIKVMVEIKKGVWDDMQIVWSIWKTLKRVANFEFLSTSIHLASLSASILKAVKHIETDLPIISVVRSEPEFEEHQAIRADIVALKYPLFNFELTQRIHNQKQILWAWTVDDLQTARTCIELGATGLITNNPRMILEYLDFH